MDTFKNLFNLKRCQKRRRPAAEIDGVRTRDPLPVYVQLSDQGLDILGNRAGVGDGVKITVRAFGPAERDMDIKPRRGGGEF